MSESKGGFIVERVDADVGAAAYDVVRAYLTRAGIALAGYTLSFATSRSASSMAIEIAGWPAERQGSMRWPETNHALGGELAKALGCRAWVWGQEDLVGSEFVFGFGPSGEPILEEHLRWDDAPEPDDEDDAPTFKGPISQLAERLGSWEPAEGSAWVAIAIDEPYDASALRDHLLSFAVARSERPKGHVSFDVFLMQCVLADAKKLAQVAKSDLGQVLSRAWEMSKHALAAELTDRQGNVFALAAPSTVAPLGVAKTPPKLSDKRSMTPSLVPMHLPKEVASELRALAVHADVQYGQLASRAYLLARERLWRGNTAS